MDELLDQWILLLAAVVRQAQRDVAGIRVGNLPPSVVDRRDAQEFLDFMRKEFAQDFDPPTRGLASGG